MQASADVKDPAAPFIVEGNPWLGEQRGCSGTWKALKDVTTYSSASIKSSTLFNVKRGQEVKQIRGEIHVNPGTAEILKTPPMPPDDAKLNIKKPIYIWNYIEHGEYRVYHDGQDFQMVLDYQDTIQKQKEICDEKVGCWLRILKVPSDQWWSLIQSPDGKLEGWVLMQNYDEFDTCNAPEGSGQ